MRAKQLAFFILLCGVSSLRAATSPTQDPGYIPEVPALMRMAGTPAPALKLKTVDGGSIDLSTIYGKRPVYLKFWATYCVPCLRQMPTFEKTYETLGDKLEVIAVNAGFGDDESDVRAARVTHGLKMAMAIDDGSLGKSLNLRATPMHVLIGRDGRIAYVGHQDGPRLDEAILKVITKPEPNARVTTTHLSSIVALKQGDAVPPLMLKAANGAPVQLRPSGNKRPQVVVFFATWCESYLAKSRPRTSQDCRRVREEVDRLSQTGDIEWLGIASHMWSEPSDLVNYQTKTQTRIPLAMATDAEVFNRFGVRQIPAIALIDADGRLLRILGPNDLDIANSIRDLNRAN